LKRSWMEMGVKQGERVRNAPLRPLSLSLSLSFLALLKSSPSPARSGWPLTHSTKSRADRTFRKGGWWVGVGVEAGAASPAPPGTSLNRASPSAPWARTTTLYRRRRSGMESGADGEREEGVATATASLSATATPPQKETRPSARARSNWWVTFFVSAWSGATPERTRPKGVGSLSWWRRGGREE